MILSTTFSEYLFTRIPRESGDDPDVIAFGSTVCEYSPRERG